jgi:hypothetical protein
MAELNIANGHWVRADTLWLLDRQFKAQVPCKCGHYRRVADSCYFCELVTA